ncbi:hypothetical protein G7Y89_g8919 [Cudoniella acicularis]|uniref:Uncharacterized protein n=1 Tax=Cudoniella acicularis TaxID=354080 RepID=A0A8H4RHZ2_9HELO|nr:hypothetical protein G7Y89_g8919 [Cudoniella acicularis]
MSSSDADTTDETNSIWVYNPNFALAIIFAVLYLIPMVVQGYQTVVKYKASYFVVVLVGAALEVAGYAARAVSIKQPASVPPYAIQSAFIIIAPLFLGAGNYLLISRLALRVLPTSIKYIFRIPVAKLTRIFVIFDVVTFLVQVSGSAISSAGNWEGNTAAIGTNVLIAGLAIQLATFAFFVAIVGRFHFLTKLPGGVRDGAGEGWTRVLTAVYISSSLIIIRSIYRLIEFGLGIFGYPFTHEWMFYVLESVPMLPAFSIFCLWHPAEYFHQDSAEVKSGSSNEEEIRIE